MRILNDKPQYSNEPLFVGRRRELHALEAHFKKGGKNAWIVGRRGSGKTALAYMLGNVIETSGLFPGGWHRISAVQFPLHALEQALTELIPQNVTSRTLLLIDDFDIVPATLHEWLSKYIRQNKHLSLIICANESEPNVLNDALTINLGGLSRAEFFTLLKRRFDFAQGDDKQAKKLFELVAGDPLYADLAGKTIRELLITFNEFIHGLGEFHHSGIIGPDGNPLTTVPQGIEIAVSDTNSALLEKIRSDPTLLRDLSPRRFEEVIAELLALQGYAVDLTPPSQDGGFDIYAARKDGLGRFLFLVECKRYTPPNKVGVSIVRSLHGVVQQKQANAGIVVTSSFFTKGAQEFQQSIPYQMQLQDYIALQQWLGILK